MSRAATDVELHDVFEDESEQHMMSSLEEEKEDRFLKELHDTFSTPYVYQKELYHPTDPRLRLYPQSFNQYDKNGGPIIQAMDLMGAKHYSLSQLEQFTHSFGETNLIFELRGWKLFDAEIDQKSVLVKIWNISHGLGPQQLSDELRHLRSSKVRNHPNVVKIIGYHCDKRLAVIYEGTRPKHFLSDIIESDDFGWDDRLKVALDIASVVSAFHCQGFVHGAIEADSFMIYEDYLVMNYHFNVDYYNNHIRTAYKCCYFLSGEGHFRSDTYVNIDDSTKMTMHEDVFAYGCLLLSLICKKEKLFDVSRWWSSANKSTGDLVHESFLQEKEVVRSKVTNLVNSCLKMQEGDNMPLKPSMGDVVDILLELNGLKPPAAKRSKLS